jgi:hypothetical protein
MPYHNLPPEFILAGTIWLTAIFIFVIMLIATVASLGSKDQTETGPKLSSVVTRLTKLFPKRKTRENEDSPDLS